MSSFLRKFLFSAVTTALLSSSVGATPRADSHAPIGVMGDHSHAKGEWMASYRLMTMAMDHNYDGSTQLTPADVHTSFMISPVSMDMHMHMLGVMYAPTDKLTLMAMVHHIETSMTLRGRNGTQFQTSSDGLGDLMVSGLWSLYSTHHDKVLLNFGVSLPTGQIEVRGPTPMGPNTLYPYPMRLGSGTFDLKPGITWSHQKEGWSLGAQATALVRLDDNDRGYTLGNRFDATAWVAWTPLPAVSLSARLAHTRWGDIDGVDLALNPMMVPTARTDLRGGRELVAYVGANLFAVEGALTGHRFALEYGRVIGRDLDGPQLGTKDTLMLGWQYAF